MTEKINDDALKEVSGGYGRNLSNGGFLTVGNCPDGYLALRTHPEVNDSIELAQLYPGSQVYTFGSQTIGTGRNGSKCTYMQVNFQGTWGWADASCLH